MIYMMWVLIVCKLRMITCVNKSSYFDNCDEGNGWEDSMKDADKAGREDRRN